MTSLQEWAGKVKTPIVIPAILSWKEKRKQGGNNMDYKIVKKPAFTVAGSVKRFTTDVEENMKQIGEFCIEFMNSAERQKLVGLVKNQPGAVTGGGMLGKCLKIGQEEEWSYALAV